MAVDVKIAEHVLSFPSATGDRGLAIIVYGWLQDKRLVPNSSMNNRSTLSIDTSCAILSTSV